MKGLWLYISTAIISGMVFAIIYAPAPLAYRMIEADINVPDLAIYGVHGSIWTGTAEIRYRSFPVTTLNWSLAPSSLLALRADLDLVASGSGHQLTAMASIQSGKATISQLTGYLHSDYINTLAERYGMQFQGQLNTSGLQITTDGAWFLTASGRLDWTGGQVSLPGQTQKQYTLELPPLSADLALDGETLTLSVTHQRLPVMDVALARSGWATLGFRARLIDLAGLPLNTGAAPDDEVLTVEEKIL